MGELVFRSVVEHAHDPTATSKQMLETVYAIFTGPDKVAVTKNHKVTGVARKTGYRYVRFEKAAFWGIRRNHKGNLIPYQGGYGNERPRRKRHFTSPDVAIPNQHLTVSHYLKYNEEVLKTFGVTGLHGIYPLTNHFGIGSYGAIPKTLLRAMRHDDMRPFVVDVFGKSQVRRDLIRKAATSTPTAIEVAGGFRNIVPVDWIVNFLDNNGNSGRIMPVGNLRPLALAVNERTRRTLLFSDWTENDYMLVSNMVNRINAPRYGRHWLEMVDGNRNYRSIRELHDAILGPRAGYYTMPVKREPVTEIKQTELASKLDGIKVGNMVIVTAKHGDMMAEWSEYMSNCIRSYDRDAEAGRGVYAGVYEGDTLVANLEIKDNTLKQMLGRFNQPLPDERRGPLEAALNQAGVTVPSNYWGAAQPTQGWHPAHVLAEQPVAGAMARAGAQVIPPERFAEVDAIF